MIAYDQWIVVLNELICLFVIIIWNPKIYYPAFYFLYIQTIQHFYKQIYYTHNNSYLIVQVKY